LERDTSGGGAIALSYQAGVREASGGPGFPNHGSERHRPWSRNCGLGLQGEASLGRNFGRMKHLFIATLFAVAIAANPAIPAVAAGPASCGVAGDKYIASLINAPGDDRVQEVAYSVAGDYSAACAKHDVAAEMAKSHKSSAAADKDVYFRAYFLYLKGTALASKVRNKFIRCHDINQAVKMSVAMGQPLDTSNASVKEMLDGC
jgi:hypothetical protein